MKKKGKTILIKDADCVVTMDEKRRILRRSSVYIEGNIIKEIDTLRGEADSVIDARGMIVFPGFINTHDHTIQTFVRNVPDLRNKPIEQWIAIMCHMVLRMPPEACYYAALCSMMELVLSGCTTTTDFIYIFPKANKQKIFSAVIQAAQDMGVRVQAYRGCITDRKALQSVYPFEVIEDVAVVLRHVEELVTQYRDKIGMVRIGIGACTPFTSNKKDCREIAQFAKDLDIPVQIHVSESQYEKDYCKKQYGVDNEVKWLQEIGFQGPHVSYAHCIYISKKERSLLKNIGGVAHCPISNAHDSGDISIAPISEMIEEGVPLGIGVDGAAAKDGKNLLTEARMSIILQGARAGHGCLPPQAGLEMLTRGGAQVLGRFDDIGSLEEGKLADVVIFDVSNRLELVGSSDLIGSLVKSQSIPAQHVIINGRAIVKDGSLVTLDQNNVIRKAWKILKKHSINRRQYAS